MTVRETQEPLSAVVIGGSLSGMAAAIEAKLKGYNVTVIEKRSAFSRPQWLFLTESTIRLLEKWGVAWDGINVMQKQGGERMGFAAINQLETLLSQRISSLGIKVIHGEFLGFAEEKKAVRVAAGEGALSQAIRHLPYDVVVAADGANSRTRDALGIPKISFGKAKGASALIPLEGTPAEEMDISDSIPMEEGFIRRVKAPGVSIIFIHNPDRADRNDLRDAILRQGWKIEEERVIKGKALIIENVEIDLSQAKRFADPIRSAILIGDAAATASFFQGMGANAAFLCAEAAGAFFERFKISPQDAFKGHDKEVRKITDAMLENSAFLFPEIAEEPKAAI